MKILKTLWKWIKTHKLDTALTVLTLMSAPFEYANLWYWGFLLLWVLLLVQEALTDLYRQLCDEQDELYEECDRLRQGWKDLYFKARHELDNHTDTV